MTLSSFRRKIVVLLVAGALVAPWALAEEPRHPGPDLTPINFLSRLWSAALTALWGENGCSIDPDGRCIPGPGDGASGSGTTGDNGCSVDPSGHCIGGS